MNGGRMDQRSCMHVAGFPANLRKKHLLLTPTRLHRASAKIHVSPCSLFIQIGLHVFQRRDNQLRGPRAVAFLALLAILLVAFHGGRGEYQRSRSARRHKFLRSPYEAAMSEINSLAWGFCTRGEGDLPDYQIRLHCFRLISALPSVLRILPFYRALPSRWCILPISS